MPRKPVEVLRVPLNCLISPKTKEALTGIQNLTKESQGEIIDRLLLNLPSVTPMQEMAHKAQAAAIEQFSQARLDAWRAGRKPLLKPSAK